MESLDTDCHASQSNIINVKNIEYPSSSPAVTTDDGSKIKLEEGSASETDSSIERSPSKLRQLLHDFPPAGEAVGLNDRVAALNRRIRRERDLYLDLQNLTDRIEETDETDLSATDSLKTINSLHNRRRQNQISDPRARRRRRLNCGSSMAQSQLSSSRQLYSPGLSSPEPLILTEICEDPAEKVRQLSTLIKNQHLGAASEESLQGHRQISNSRFNDAACSYDGFVNRGISPESNSNRDEVKPSSTGSSIDADYACTTRKRTPTKFGGYRPPSSGITFRNINSNSESDIMISPHEDRRRVNYNVENTVEANTSIDNRVYHFDKFQYDGDDSFEKEEGTDVRGHIQSLSDKANDDVAEIDSELNSPALVNESQNRSQSHSSPSEAEDEGLKSSLDVNALIEALSNISLKQESSSKAEKSPPGYGNRFSESSCPRSSEYTPAVGGSRQSLTSLEISEAHCLKTSKANSTGTPLLKRRKRITGSNSKTSKISKIPSKSPRNLKNSPTVSSAPRHDLPLEVDLVRVTSFIPVVAKINKTNLVCPKHPLKIKSIGKLISPRKYPAKNFDGDITDKPLTSRTNVSQSSEGSRRSFYSQRSVPSVKKLQGKKVNELKPKMDSASLSAPLFGRRILEPLNSASKIQQNLSTNLNRKFDRHRRSANDSPANLPPRTQRTNLSTRCSVRHPKNLIPRPSYSGAPMISPSCDESSEVTSPDGGNSRVLNTPTNSCKDVSCQEKSLREIELFKRLPNEISASLTRHAPFDTQVAENFHSNKETTSTIEDLRRNIQANNDQWIKQLQNDSISDSNVEECPRFSANVSHVKSLEYEKCDSDKVSSIGSPPEFRNADNDSRNYSRNPTKIPLKIPFVSFNSCNRVQPRPQKTFEAEKYDDSYPSFISNKVDPSFLERTSTLRDDIRQELLTHNSESDQLLHFSSNSHQNTYRNVIRSPGSCDKTLEPKITGQNSTTSSSTNESFSYREKEEESPSKHSQSLLKELEEQELCGNQESSKKSANNDIGINERKISPINSIRSAKSQVATQQHRDAMRSSPASVKSFSSISKLQSSAESKWDVTVVAGLNTIKKSQDRFPFTISESATKKNSKFKIVPEVKSNQILQEQNIQVLTQHSILAKSGDQEKTSVDNEPSSSPVLRLSPFLEKYTSKISSHSFHDFNSKIPSTELNYISYGCREEPRTLMPTVKGLVRKFSARLSRARTKLQQDETKVEILYRNKRCHGESGEGSSSAASLYQSQFLPNKLIPTSRRSNDGKAMKQKRNNACTSISTQHTPRKSCNRNDLWIEEFDSDTEIKDPKTEVTSRINSPEKNRDTIFFAKCRISGITDEADGKKIKTDRVLKYCEGGDNDGVTCERSDDVVGTFTDVQMTPTPPRIRANSYDDDGEEFRIKNEDGNSTVESGCCCLRICHFFISSPKHTPKRRRRIKL